MTPDQLAQAACRWGPTELWFPKPNTTRRGWTVGQWRQAASAAIAVCEACPVVEPCRDEAIKEPRPLGVRAALTPPELRALHISRPVAGHGTRNRYSNGCRCDDCRQANTHYQRRKREAS